MMAGWDPWGGTYEDGTPLRTDGDGYVVGCRRCGGEPGPAAETHNVCLACGYEPMRDAYGWRGSTYLGTDVPANREDGLAGVAVQAYEAAAAERSDAALWQRVAWLDADPGVPPWHLSEGAMDVDTATLPEEAWLLGDALNGPAAASGPHFCERFEPVFKGGSR